jgi:hypothetical protein
MPLGIKDSLELVLELAEQNIIDDPELHDLRIVQLAAFETVRQFIENYPWQD